MADSLDIKLEVKGDKEIKQMLTGVGLDVKDLRGAMKSVGGNISYNYFGGKVFASRGQIIGQPWAKLSDRYAAQKAKRWPGRIPLVRTGVMRQSWKYTTTPMSVTITNTAPYFKYHQSTKARKKLPRRAMIGIGKQMQDDITNTIALHLQRAIKKRAG